MKHIKIIAILTLAIAILSILSCVAGLQSWGVSPGSDFLSVRGEQVMLHGTGIYRHDSVDVAAQGLASDLITLAAAVPTLLAALYFAARGSFRGALLLAGALGYFLYTYMSYTFLWMYNDFFLVYVALMSASLFAFILTLLSIGTAGLPERFDKKLPVRFLGGFQLFVAAAVCALWLGKIVPTIHSGLVPAGLGHYTTLVIQGMDLGIVVPAAIVSGILLIRRRPLGYLLSSVIIIKGIMMLTAISAMIISMAASGVAMQPAEAILFPALNLLAVACLVILMRGVRA